MIFLKRIEAFGFKSFAEPTTLNYDFAMTGIVGPNGSGKSNITDAIMWALGEQSSKSLRGDSMEDIVFSGSSDRKGLNMAEVTLVFDNSKRAFSSLDYNEVSITRKYFKITKESEYYINGAKVRLKDIQDVALETGLTKSSLAIISQGSISTFVESSPEQRRRLFDEAAGVARYKKRKEEAIRKLIRSQENLDRLNDIINEIERKLPSLKRQSKKALEYQTKFDELKQIEVAVLVKDIQLYKQRINELNDEKIEMKTKISSLEKEIQTKSDEFNNINRSSFEKEKELSKLNREYTKIVDEIGKLKVSRISLESKKSKVDIDDKEFRISDLKNKAKELEIKLNSEEQKLSKLLADKVEKRTNLDSLSKERFDINSKLDYIRKDAAKIETSLETLNMRKNSHEGLFEGVKNILENKKVLSGIIGTVQDVINVDKEYEIAASSILQNSLQNIVANNSSDVKQAIEFLKSNKAGYATFLPLDTLKANFISSDMRFAIQKADGFIGFANELIKTEKKYQIVLDYLLANHIVVKKYDNAIEIAKLTNYKFHIVTLDGERVLPHGAIVGGSRKVKNNLLNESVKISELEIQKQNLDLLEKELIEKVAQLSDKIEIHREEIQEIQIAIGASKQSTEIIERETAEVREEYRILTGKELNGSEQGFQSVDEQIIEIIEQISKQESLKEEIQQQINVLRSIKDKSNDRQNTLNSVIDEDRIMLSALKDQYSKITTDGLLMFEKQSSAQERLAQNYNLTYEAALELESTSIEDEQTTRDRINKLRNEIKSLGNVNLDSIEEYEEENQRYETYVSQTNDVLESINNLKEAINDMDEQMIVQFKKIIKDVNNALPNTFATLFGGGSANLIYTNPDDILNSGIDIKISPPGKKISNLNLLSGGEKSMVALSVLFSILKVKPIPLVILDEVEAPLDIANVERFAKYIKTFTTGTQFMIVTHRIGTMENCDILFGATMQQKGITKLVQIKLVEAKQMSNSN
ncbi:chromosome segregation protein SMC [Spiroplasma culicicola]|uniref:Chromosome partition protein Smc n=1 Tax=Spiroplasma culicicola AES-1 TaxID=1276246 RepID=W6A869_9MOLU|nr:chromosome segregation protein SMC [Spiroplasma culicicola]AHI53182.1 chromosome condensation and segregation SMC ATPase [Spiroplasma culicicola AES-1]